MKRPSSAIVIHGKTSIMKMLMSVKVLIITEGNKQISERRTGNYSDCNLSESPTYPNKHNTAAAVIFFLIYLKKMDIQSEKERIEDFQLSSHLLIIPK